MVECLFIPGNLSDPAVQAGLVGGNGKLTIDTAEGGKVLSLSTWATREDLDATEASGWYQEQVAKFATTWVAPPVRDIYEVAMQVEAARAVGGA